MTVMGETGTFRCDANVLYLDRDVGYIKYMHASNLIKLHT